jgi:hypothetical protein
MDSSSQNLETLKDIKRIMERSSRFISLSGLSGIVVGICALIGATAAWYRIRFYYKELFSGSSCASCLKWDLIIIASIVFVVAFILATLFTFLKTKKEGVAIWGSSAKRLLWNTMLPMLAGGCVLLRMIQLEQYELVAPACLIFYGLALVNGSKYTMGEVRYLGYAEIILGVISLWFHYQGLYYWAIGFGIFHIIYGVVMWWKYERSSKETEVGMHG